MKINVDGQKLILDVDTGVDDALAILLLAKFASEQLLGITTCGGNVEVEQVTKNTLGVLDLQKNSIKVYQGANKNFQDQDFRYAKDYHGENGLLELAMPAKQVVEMQSAADFIIESVNKNANNVTIIATAPLTNVARALVKAPEIADKISQIIVMGGAISVPGNETDWAEFNFYQDPEAVKIVFEKVKNIFVIPLDVTGKCLVYEQNIGKLNSKAKIGGFVVKLISNWYKIFGRPNNRFFELYDPLAVGAVMSDFLNFKEAKVNIETKGGKRGALVKGDDYKINYAYEVDSQKFMEFFYKHFGK